MFKPVPSGTAELQLYELMKAGRDPLDDMRSQFAAAHPKSAIEYMDELLDAIGGRVPWAAKPEDHGFRAAAETACDAAMRNGPSEVARRATEYLRQDHDRF